MNRIMSVTSVLCLIVAGVCLADAGAGADGKTVVLKATADAWLSDANNEERDSSAGQAKQFKLKSIQEMAAIRFDVEPARGYEVLGAKLFLRRAGEDKLRHIRVSTINAEWVEGSTVESYGPASGATWNWADADTKRPWAWGGSAFCDVIMSSGNSIADWADCAKLADGWVSVELDPILIYAMVAGDTDGLAVQEGGTVGLHNNMIHSCQSAGSEPYIQVQLGKKLDAAPAKPKFKAEPCVDRAHMTSGAIKVAIESSQDVVCWKLTVDGRPVERWRVSHPAATGSTVVYVEDLPPAKSVKLAVVAVARGGQVSELAEASVVASSALKAGPALGQLREPASADGAGLVLPGLLKLSPEAQAARSEESGAVLRDGAIRVAGARGEYVSYQLVLERPADVPSVQFFVDHQPLTGPDGAVIGLGEVELFKVWYAKNKNGDWQSAYCVPMPHGEPYAVPDASRNLPDQRVQSVYVDIYIPKDAKPGDYRGQVAVRTGRDGAARVLPVVATVWDFALPDRLSFWPELNAYRIPKDVHDYYRLAHQHRATCNFWRFTPKLTGKGKAIKVVWDQYDALVGPLVSGEAFKNNRRAGVPTPCMYLPFEDSWPTPLSPENYNYPAPWPGKGDSTDTLVKQMLESTYIGDALSDDYKEAFLAVEKQFIEHFAAKGWNQTEMQCFYGGKKSHRTDHGTNMWWTTDEPYHWDDWLALQYFDWLWVKGRGQADTKVWAARADISRPQWQGRVLDGIVDTVYFGTGAFSSQAMYRRCQILEQDTGLKTMCYGSANSDTASNTQTVVWMLNAWLNGANGVLPWQTLGPDKALDINDGATMGNALLVPGDRFGLPVVADIRLKAMRDGEQLIEYLTILCDRYNLTREQVRDMIARVIQITAGVKAGAGADNADALRFSGLKMWQIGELRRAIAELIVAK